MAGVYSSNVSLFRIWGSACLLSGRYPSSNAKKKNWNDIEKEAEKELAEEKPEGDEALNKLFREIYGYPGSGGHPAV